jgi:hypothetical protein
MTKQRVQLGQVILIPITNERYVVGQVLFVSKVFRNVILLSVHDQCVTIPVSPSVLGRVVCRLYTSSVPIKMDRWITVGQTVLDHNNALLTQRIVGGEVWIEDTRVREATREDFEILPIMEVVGATLVEKKCLRYFLN